MPWSGLGAPHYVLPFQMVSGSAVFEGVLPDECNILRFRLLEMRDLAVLIVPKSALL